MKIYITGILVLLITAALCGVLIHAQTTSPSDAVKGQANTTLTFYGKVVDQDGMPIAGAKIEYRVEAYPSDWSFRKPKPNTASYITFVSGADGLFQSTVSGCTMRMKNATYDGYKLFEETDLRDANENIQTRFYSLSAQGDVWYKSDPNHPAIYVFVKDGIKEASALPCHGGYGPGRGQMRLYEPGWPTKPSLKDVVRKFPSSLPTSQP